MKTNLKIKSAQIDNGVLSSLIMEHLEKQSNVDNVANLGKSNLCKSNLEKSGIISKENAIIGFKGFGLNGKGNLQCLNQEYEVGKEYIIVDNDIKICKKGFHFCRDLQQVFNHYSNDGANVFHEVKGWGKYEEQDDKIAVSHIEIGKKIEKDELNNFLLKLIMKNVDLIIQDNPNAIISGSLALILSGLLDYRKIKDIDITLPFYGGFNKSIFKSKFGESGNDTILMELHTGNNDDVIKYDLFINPKAIYTKITFDNKEYKIADIPTILQAKFKYLTEGSIKHWFDIKNIFEKLGNKGYFLKDDNDRLYENYLNDFYNDFGL